MTSRKNPAWLALGVSVLAGFSTIPARADSLESNPTAWLLQDYLDGAVYVYHTSSPCIDGKLFIPATGPADAKNRFWSLVLSAKMSNKIVGIYYNPTTCEINSFYLVPG
ncbi:hypothetical protein [Asticcacaulis sp. 201]|uniref:hypothetical protein n=1 Tax=Asticcacaulis sp. 201 TaxID=3028787 RepID=UPI002916B4B8|nr:hypothetical protein [Asticcacaulis sp. 201]MDV6331295.1 hypothetical protein [Asticcacaulis sp. 201]